MANKALQCLPGVRRTLRKKPAENHEADEDKNGPGNEAHANDDRSCRCEQQRDERDEDDFGHGQVKGTQHQRAAGMLARRRM
jgi:hypothetical protein